MDSQAHKTVLTALLIAPDRGLADQFQQSVSGVRTFQVMAELKSYPSEHTLEIRLRQVKPDVVLIDVGTDLEKAIRLVEFVSNYRPATQVVGLHRSNDSAAVVRTLRAGASEFLWAPFEAQQQLEAVARIQRLRQPASAETAASGRVLVFASAKPGSGASTIAVQTAFALRRATGDRVLVLDLDLTGGTLGFYLKLHHTYSVVDLFERSDGLDPAVWASLVAHCDGVDVVPAPDEPDNGPIEPSRLHDALEFSRMLYSWVILDAPALPHRTSLLTVSEADEAFVVTTSELASLHLTRRAVSLLEQLGFTKERYRVLVNRTSKRDGITASDMEKIFNCPVSHLFPNDYFSLHRVISLGHALGPETELGRALEKFAAKLVDNARRESQRSAAVEAQTAQTA